MHTVDQFAELVVLWDLLQNVQLSDEPDTIRWHWTADGAYTARSAYKIQFQGTFSSFNSKAIWDASAEGKHKFFSWLLVQSRILTADQLTLRNWSCDPMCILCDQELEIAGHLCLHCVYACEVWALVSTWSEGLIQVPTLVATVESWWNGSVQGRPKQLRKQVAALLTYTS
jgi:hypothetical protein